MWRGRNQGFVLVVVLVLERARKLHSPSVFDPEQLRVRENPSDLIVPFEHEHDDEHKDD